jgi:hypothetical protein
MTMLEGFWENNQGLSQKNVTLSETLSLVGQTGGKGLKKRELRCFTAPSASLRTWFSMTKTGFLDTLIIKLEDH